MAWGDGRGMSENGRVGEPWGCDWCIGFVGWSEYGEPLEKVKAAREVKSVEGWISEVAGARTTTWVQASSWALRICLRMLLSVRMSA